MLHTDTASAKDPYQGGFFVSKPPVDGVGLRQPVFHETRHKGGGNDGTRIYPWATSFSSNNRT